MLFLSILTFKLKRKTEVVLKVVLVVEVNNQKAHRNLGQYLSNISCKIKRRFEKIAAKAQVVGTNRQPDCRKVKRKKSTKRKRGPNPQRKRGPNPHRAVVAALRALNPPLSPVTRLLSKQKKHKSPKSPERPAPPGKKAKKTRFVSLQSLWQHSLTTWTIQKLWQKNSLVKSPRAWIKCTLLASRPRLSKWS